MGIGNTARSYGSLARGFHWLTALLILLAWPLGFWAEGLPFGTSEELALKAQAFSVHKTLGVAVFGLAVLRLIWALVQPHPAPINPERRAEVWVAGFVHWLLYGAILIVPLSGWLHHAATEGFAPILWPLGQGLPFVPVSESLAKAAGLVHWISTKLILVAVGLHVAGALKHALIDRDGTVMRMISGREAGAGGRPLRGTLIAAVVIWGLSMVPAFMIPRTETTVPDVVAVEGGNWLVEEGALAISVRQLGSEVSGKFKTWSAEITFDPEAQVGNRVEVTVDVASLELGSVSSQAVGKDFLNAPAYPTATYKADLQREGEAWIAKGQLDLAGQTVAFDLPFTLQIEGDRAQMSGEAPLDRRDFGIGASYGDEATVGFGVTIKVDLVAKRR